MLNAHLKITLATALLLTGCAHAAPGAVRAAAGLAAAAGATDRLVVGFKPQAARQAVLQKLGLRAVDRVPGLDALVVTAAPGALAALKADPGVAWVQPNKRRNWLPTEAAAPALALETGDDLLETLWGMRRIDAPAAWQVSTGSRDVTVAVVDTGVDYTHPDLGGRVVKGHDFVNDDEDPMDDDGHGTHCAGTIAAGIGDGGVVGVCPNATILAVKVLDAKGWGDDVGVAKGIVWAADHGAPILNLSIGGAENVKVIDEAVAYATAKGALCVAAMGNEHSGDPSWPAASPGAMPVSALTPDNILASYSNWGDHVSVNAPGTWIMSTLPGPRWARRSGTSMATPHVAGLAALVKSVAPALDAAGLRERIESTARDVGYPGWDKFYGHGCVDARQAIAR